MGRKPLPLGSWGLIRTYPVDLEQRGRPSRVRAITNYRDFDGITRRVEASGRTATMATQTYGCGCRAEQLRDGMAS
jgi:hypothetical protein